jgi:hypothetical protein
LHYRLFLDDEPAGMGIGRDYRDAHEFASGK